MGNDSVRGLKVMETIYPSPDHKSVFDKDPKLKAKLDKELAKAKGTDQHKEEHPDEEPIDGDMDSVIDRVVKSVWEYYDPKQKGFLDKKRGEQFFKDGFEVYALRKGQKSKEALGPGIKLGSALQQCFQTMNKSGNGKITYEEFVEYLNCYDIEEAMAPFTGQQAVTIDTTKVPMVDTSQFKGQKKEGPKLVYRNYNL
eukprot:TRINITY_DN5350_c0_g1_i1.p1 TRINITY_DN5350_c0_g1~~TRINITY_DN5350_c0_g1_i1.p1  ORF type:complete len:198 (-),score=51.33 TRINITY_DN5350_c0_g1_i1:112-705(-)